MDQKRELFRLLAELLEYPDSALPQRARRCCSLLAELRPEAAAAMDSFVVYVESEPSGKLEEVYTATFDLKPQCYPYAGYQLFGEEDPRRTELMVKLRQSYRDAEFDDGGDLPDHVALLLRFLTHGDDQDLKRELGDLVLMPTLKKMAEALNSKGNPYGSIVSAAHLVVEKGLRAEG